ncbi:MAG: ribosome maturation factor RimP [Desulfatiglans sp.]|jgi:ribosome maturation factor RimP|nr:ribosome maturation factor RimP [Thermodesulfobacteriota bacterium]MEE4351320.1 ribosome maturation factor RimP [Desulfatiglans sp.]
MDPSQHHDISGSVIDQVMGLVEPLLDHIGFELIDVEYVTEHGRRVLRFYIDKEGGITLDECAMISRRFGDVIDQEDIFHHEYVLEVSSPGLDRRLKREKDFQKVVGKRIKAVMMVPIQGRRKFTGLLRAVEDGVLSLEIEKEIVLLPLRNIAKANLIFEFED